MCKEKKDIIASLVVFVLVIIVAFLALTAWSTDCKKKPVKPVPTPIVIETDEVSPEPVKPVKPPCPCPGPCKKPDKTPMPKVCDPVKVLAFTASWCQPCQKAKPKLLELKKNGLNLEIIDIDQNPSLARQNVIVSVPTFLVYKDGKVIRTHDVAVVVDLSK